MCQLNVYMLKNNVGDEDVSKCFELEGFCQNISEMIQIDGLSDRYKSYCNTFSMCDCNSIISKLAGKKVNYHSYEEYFEKTKEEQINHLYKIRDFLLLPESKDQLEKFKKESEFLFQQTLNEPVKMNENQIYEVGPKTKNYQDFLEKNKFLSDANLYSLEKPSDNIFSIFIDDAIKEAKNASMENITKEFEILKQQIKNMLKISDDVKVFAFWQNEEFVDDVKEEKNLPFHELKMEDFVFLDYKRIVTITK